eukprot:TRINITY_DN12055_c0_g1_i1.p1 TRINITY_DN12055_c0_g1~~TRINITY_DN12055_c0_g1_i1.p1  ORF type:complete len:1489 (-),score=363.13 TRINITY_DN12055_c0_g1_i1:172-4638(-)
MWSAPIAVNRYYYARNWNGLGLDQLTREQYPFTWVVSWPTTFTLTRNLSLTLTELDVNECLTNNGGCGNKLCIDTVPGYHCSNNECITPNNVYPCDICSSGLYGPNCTEVCKCAHGRCNEGINGDGTCTCDSKWKGEFCQIDVNECETNNGGCVNRRCINTLGSFTCGECFAGFALPSCQNCDSTHFGPRCDRNCTCVNGVCDSGKNGKGTCICNIGWDGPNCDRCASGYWGTTCANRCPVCQHGTCDDGISGSGVCNCFTGYTGPLCQNTTDRCLKVPAPCDDNAICISSNISSFSVRKRTIVEKYTVELRCPAESEIIVVGASWGTNCGAVPAADGLPVVQALCEGLNYCVFVARNLFFGSNPCAGVTKTGLLTYACVGHVNCLCKEGFVGDGIPALAGGKGCNDTNECLTNNGGCGHFVCRNTLGSRTCGPDCEQGWIGENCDKQCYGNGCALNCTCTSQGTCNSTNGLCTHPCNAGWSGDNCETPCDSTHFGPDCDKPCTCIHGSCDPKTGACTCESGWTAANCDQPCSSNKFGPNCINDCTCGIHGACNSTDGTCVCEAGWKGANCTEKCYNPECTTPCQCIHGTCNANGGCVKDTCESGWKGQLCDSQCDPFTFGSNCSNPCSCDTNKSSSCDPSTGVCYCNPGFTGANCAQPCADGTYGKDCTEVCKCSEHATCNPVTGACDCKPGWSGVNCDIACIGDCDKKCTCVHGVCDQLTGHCSKCDAGWTGTDCDQPCVGTNPCKPCTCVHGVCNSAGDGCQPGSCEAGWTGKNCNETCTSNTWGPDCANTPCTCKHGECDPVTGTCSKCDVGWDGIDCDVQCYDDCTQICTCQRGVCNQTTGLCEPDTCPSGWTGANCDVPCDKNHYGPNCALICDPLCVHGACNSSGVCMCEAGWTGPTCNDKCTNSSCLQLCVCVHGECDLSSTTGECTPGSCEVGWTGPNCDKPCTNNTWGANCENPCKCKTGVCDILTGSCDCTEPGWTGGYCDQPCMEGTYGVHCSNTCECGEHGHCNPVNGSCTCDAGYTGTLCNDVCPDGTFGLNCQGTCDCVNGTCDKVTGACLCYAGYFGEKCDELCWGEPCVNPCTCVHGFCNSTNGECTCQPGWQGKDCDVPCTEGTFGSNCTSKCVCQGQHSTCDPVTGECSCDVGYMGDSCDQQCLDPQCTKPCKCEYGICDKTTEDGACLPDTCELGWSGLYCNEIKPTAIIFNSELDTQGNWIFQVKTSIHPLFKLNGPLSHTYIGNLSVYEDISDCDTTISNACIQSFTLYKLGCKFDGTSFDVISSLGCRTGYCPKSGPVRMGLSLITETCPSTYVQILSSDPSFQTNLLFHADNPLSTEDVPGFTFPTLFSTATFYFTANISGPEGFVVSSYHLNSATLDGKNVAGSVLDSTTGHFSTRSVVANEWFSTTGQKTLIFEVSVDIVIQKRGIFRVSSSMQVPSDYSARQPIYIVVGSSSVISGSTYVIPSLSIFVILSLVSVFFHALF